MRSFRCNVTQVILKNFPLVIDPATSGLEVMSCESDGPHDESAGHWIQMHRLNLVAAQAPFTVTNEEAHLFGASQVLQDCPMVLCYNGAGILTCIWVQHPGGGWERRELADELTGHVVQLPSIRFIFADERDQHNFLQVLQRMQESARKLELPAQRDGHELITILSRSPHPPRMLYVGKVPDVPTA